jgi:hypothetical protein
MTATAGARQREWILRAAASFTTRRDDAMAVAINAGPLLAWVEAAADYGDMRSRVRAVTAHQNNRSCLRPGDPGADDPEAFLRGVQTLFAFATAGQR